jgi:t-SNARE complex subunit (syntaxin)
MNLSNSARRNKWIFWMVVIGLVVAVLAGVMAGVQMVFAILTYKRG